MIPTIGSFKLTRICVNYTLGLDVSSLVRKIARCLKPGGTFAAFSYYTIGSQGHPAIDFVLRNLEVISLENSLPSPDSKDYLEAAHSHYDNVAVSYKDFTHETRFHWNLKHSVLYRQSDRAAADRRNINSLGYKETIEPLSQ